MCTYVCACVPPCTCQWRETWSSPAFDLLLAAGQVSHVAASLYSGTAELSLQILTQSNMLRHIYALFFSGSFSLPPNHTHTHTMNELIIPFSYSSTHIHHRMCFVSQVHRHGDECSHSLNNSPILYKQLNNWRFIARSVLNFLPLVL